MDDPQPKTPERGAASLNPAVVSFDDEARQIVLTKKGQRFVFRYEQGSESRLLAHLVELVQKPDNDLDWFDAAMLSHQMGRRMCKQMNHLLKAS